MSWHVFTAPAVSVMPTGSSQQSAPVTHSPLQVLPVAWTPYDARSQVPPAPEARGTQTSPAAQSPLIEHDSPRSLARGGGAASGLPPSSRPAGAAAATPASGGKTDPPAPSGTGAAVPLVTQVSATQTRPPAQSAVRAHDSPPALSTGACELLLQPPTAPGAASAAPTSPTRGNHKPGLLLMAPERRARGSAPKLRLRYQSRPRPVELSAERLVAGAPPPSPRKHPANFNRSEPRQRGISSRRFLATSRLHSSSRREEPCPMDMSFTKEQIAFRD